MLKTMWFHSSHIEFSHIRRQAEDDTSQVWIHREVSAKKKKSHEPINTAFIGCAAYDIRTSRPLRISYRELAIYLDIAIFEIG